MTTPPHNQPPNPVPDEEESDLQRFLRNARDFMEEHGTRTLLMILIVLLLIVGFQWYTGREERAREAGYTDLALATSPLGKQDVARRYEHVPGLPGKAYLEAAELLMAEAMGMPTEPGVEPRELTEEERQEHFERAAELYQRVIDRRHSTLQVLNARFGRAAVYENLGDFEAASAEYERITEEAAAEWPALAELAGDFETDLPRIAQPVRFPEGPGLDDAPAIPEGADGEQLRLDLDAPPTEGDELPDVPFTLPEEQPVPEDAPDEPIIPEPEPEPESP